MGRSTDWVGPTTMLRSFASRATVAGREGLDETPGDTATSQREDPVTQQYPEIVEPGSEAEKDVLCDLIGALEVAISRLPRTSDWHGPLCRVRSCLCQWVGRPSLRLSRQSPEACPGELRRVAG
jgi:hypothetical protein